VDKAPQESREVVSRTASDMPGLQGDAGRRKSGCARSAAVSVIKQTAASTSASTLFLQPHFINLSEQHYCQQTSTLTTTEYHTQHTTAVYSRLRQTDYKRLRQSITNINTQTTDHQQRKRNASREAHAGVCENYRKTDGDWLPQCSIIKVTP